MSQEELDMPATEDDLLETGATAMPMAVAPKRRGFARRVIGSTFNYGLGNIIPKLIRFPLTLLFMVVIKPQGFGFIDLSNKVSGFLASAMKLGVPGAVTRFYFDYSEGPSLRDYVTTVMWFVIGCTLSVALVAVLIGPFVLRHLIPDLPFVPYVVLGILSALLLSITEMQDRLVQAREQSGYAARLAIGRTVIYVGVAILFVFGLKLGAEGVLSAEVASFGVLAVVAVRYLRADLRGKIRRPMVKSSLAYGMALIPGDLVGNFTPLVTQGILANARSISSSGLYAAGWRFAQPQLLLVAAFQTAFNPIYFSMRKESTKAGMRTLADTARNLWALAIFIAIGVALVGPWLFIHLTPRDYHPAMPLIPIFSVYFLGSVIYGLTVPELFYSKQTWWFPVFIYTSAAIEILVTALTARKFGPVGVGCASTARMLSNAVFVAVISRRLIKIPYCWFDLLRITICGLLVASTIFWMPWHHGLLEVAIGVAAVALFPLLLLISGDPSVREGWRLGRRILSRMLRADFS
jgi:O-antigen/teichoic acid export membrane protein